MAGDLLTGVRSASGGDYPQITQLTQLAQGRNQSIEAN